MPKGMSPGQGAYVRYDHEATVAALAQEAARAGAVAIGEDLGTVDPWIRRYLAAHRILGTTMLWFADEPDGDAAADRRRAGAGAGEIRRGRDWRASAQPSGRRGGKGPGGL